jgi:hypothetical protein
MHALCHVGMYTHFEVLVLTAAERQNRYAWRVGTAVQEDDQLVLEKLVHDDHLSSF